MCPFSLSVLDLTLMNGVALSSEPLLVNDTVMGHMVQQVASD